MVIGITGNSGSGKTSLSNLLKEEYNAFVINADEIVKELSCKGNIYYDEIVKEFGTDVLSTDGELNKKKLARDNF